MSDFDLRSGAGGAGTGADWANAFTTQALALSGRAATDRVFAADDHSESTAGAVTVDMPSTGVGFQLIGVNTHTTDPPTGRSASPPQAIIAVGASNNGLLIQRFGHIFGVHFQGGTNSSSSCLISIGSANVPHAIFLESCKLELRTNSTSAAFFLASSSSTSMDDCLIVILDTSFKFSANQSIILRSGRIKLRKISIDSAGSTPTTLFTGVNGAPGMCEIEASDLSGEAFTNLCSAAWPSPYFIDIRDSKVPASFALTTGTHSGPGGLRLRLFNCDNGDTNYNYASSDNSGTVVDETTLIRSGGGAVSYRMDSSANTRFPYYPHESIEYAIWNDTVGSAVTLTVPILHDSATDLDDDEIALELLHLGTSGVPLGVIADDAAADEFATPAAQADDSGASWTTTGMSNPNKQKVSVTFTAQEVGYVHFKVHYFKPSGVVYADLGGASLS